MDRLSRRALEILAGRFRTLANATRLEILNLLCEREMTVGQLLDETGQKQANMSKQLGILLSAGFVRRRADGIHACYSIANLSLPVLCEVMQGIIRDTQAERRI